MAANDHGAANYRRVLASRCNDDVEQLAELIRHQKVLIDRLETKATLQAEVITKQQQEIAMHQTISATQRESLATCRAIIDALKGDAAC